MSTIRATNFGPVSGTATNAMEGLAKAWANLNGTGTIALRDSFNVSSVTDNGTGNYSINKTTAMNNANYTASGLARTDGVANGTLQAPAGSQTATSLAIASFNSSNSAFDAAQIYIAIHGDLA